MSYIKPSNCNYSKLGEFLMVGASAVTIKLRVFGLIARVSALDEALIVEDTELLGSGSIIDSMKLVELCLALEDLACDLDFDFDWTSDAAMSRSRSMFRTAGSLASEFIIQMETKK